jgi:hypothetical protein
LVDNKGSLSVKFLAEKRTKKSG